MNGKVAGGDTPLHYAVVTENRIAVKILLANGAFVHKYVFCDLGDICVNFIVFFF